MRTGIPAPSAPRVGISDGAFVRDKYLNALGGVRTPAVDVPASTEFGGGNSGMSPLCFLIGISVPLTAAQLNAAYPQRDDYVSAAQQSAARAVREGFLLSPDALQIDQAAATSTVGLPTPTG